MTFQSAALTEGSRAEWRHMESVQRGWCRRGDSRWCWLLDDCVVRGWLTSCGTCVGHRRCFDEFLKQQEQVGPAIETFSKSRSCKDGLPLKTV